MACEQINGELELHFLEGGFRARPTEVEVREAQGRFVAAEFKFSEEAGRYISANHFEAEPVILYIGDTKAYRFYVPPDPVSIRRRLDREAQARVVLEDAARVLARGNIENSWGTTTLETLFRYIFENRDDPNDVITELRILDEVDKQNLVASIPGFASDPALEWIIENVSPAGIQYEMGGYDFAGETPLTALQMVAKEAETDIHVDVDGVLTIGPRKLVGDVYSTGADDDNITLSRYDLTQTTDEVKRVQVTGGFNLKYTERRGAQGSQTKGLKPVAVVEDPGAGGSTVEVDAPSVQTLAQAKEVAGRVLVNQVAKNTNGSVVINAGASDNAVNDLGELHIGDYFVFGEDIPTKCEENVIDGTFVVEEVMHRIGNRSGWRITLELSRIPDAAKFTTKSFYYDPQSGQNFEDLESYNEYLSTQTQTGT